MFISNNLASFRLWWEENLVKNQEVSKYSENDCRWKTAVKKRISHQVFIEFSGSLWINKKAGFISFKLQPTKKNVAYQKHRFVVRWDQVNFLVYGQDSKKVGSVGWQKKKKYYLILMFKYVGMFKKIIFCIANTEEIPAIYNLL